MGTIKSVVAQLRAIFESVGRGKEWDPRLGVGNPAAAPEVRQHCRWVAYELAQGHVVPRQARPLFLDKLRCITRYVLEELQAQDLTSRKCFQLLRDKAFFTMQFFSAGRCSDLCKTLVQELRRLPGEEGLVLRQTCGKTLSQGQYDYTFFRSMRDTELCPVAHVQAYVGGATAMGVDLATGYLFRPVTESGIVLEDPLQYQDVYDQLRRYLKKLCLWEGETPHGIRGGAAVTFLLTGRGECKDVMSLGGWKSESMAKRYSRQSRFAKRQEVSSRLAEAVGTENPKNGNDAVQNRFRGVDFDVLPAAF